MNVKRSRQRKATLSPAEEIAKLEASMKELFERFALPQHRDEGGTYYHVACIRSCQREITALKTGMSLLEVYNREKEGNFCFRLVARVNSFVFSANMY